MGVLILGLALLVCGIVGIRVWTRFMFHLPNRADIFTGAVLILFSVVAGYFKNNVCSSVLRRN